MAQIDTRQALKGHTNNYIGIFGIACRMPDIDSNAAIAQVGSDDRLLEVTTADLI